MAQSNIPSGGAEAFIEKSISGMAADINNTNTNSIPASYFNNVFSIADAAAILGDDALSSAKRKNIIKNTNLLVDIEQDILENMSENSYYDALIDLLISNASDTTISTNTTLTDVHIYDTLTINNGVTLTLDTTVDGKPAIIVANEIINNGTIVKYGQIKAIGEVLRISTNVTGHGGAGHANEYGGGGRDGADGGTGVDAGMANTNTTKTKDTLADVLFKSSMEYSIETSQNKGALAVPYTIPLVYTAGGAIGWSDGDQAGAGGGGIFLIVKTLTNTGTIKADGVDGASKAGAGNGGEIIIYATDFNNTGTIQAKGGNAAAGAGGVGGGGIIYILYKTLTSTGTLTLTAGTVGYTTGGTAGSSQLIDMN